MQIQAIARAITKFTEGKIFGIYAEVKALDMMPRTN